MARTVADAAALLGAIAGSDPRDPATAEADANRVDYTKHLDPNRLKGARLGVVRSQFGGRNDLASAQVERALEVLRDKGAILVDIPALPGVDKIGNKELLVLQYEIKAAMGQYLSEYAPGFRMQTLADVIAFNEKNRAKVMPWFGQELFEMSQARGGLDAPEYVQALDEIRRVAREAIDKTLSENNLDALVAPTGAPPWLTDFIRGDNSGGGFTSPAAVAGYPHVTVPAGFVHGLPCGLSFVGTAWSEARLIALAYAFERATKHRRAPTYPSTVNSWMPK
jgi:amidase